MIQQLGIRATTYDIIGYLIPGIFDISLFSITLKVLNKALFTKLVSLATQFGWFRYLFVFSAIYAVGHLHSNAAKAFMKLIRTIPFLGPRLSPSWQSALDNMNKDVFARIFRWKFGYDFSPTHKTDDASLRQLKAYFDTTCECPGFTLLRFQSFYSLAASLALFLTIAFPVGAIICSMYFHIGLCCVLLLTLLVGFPVLTICMYMHRYNVKLYNSVLVCSLINEYRKMEEYSTSSKKSDSSP